MSPKKKSIASKVTFSAPVETIPESSRGYTGHGAEHWNQVAAHVKEQPGLWHPVRVEQFSTAYHRQATGNINGSDVSKRFLAFRQDGFKAAFRDGELYVRYDVPATVRSIKAAG